MLVHQYNRSCSCCGTSVESTIDEANIAGATAASDAGGDATHIVDADGAFSVPLP